MSHQADILAIFAERAHLGRREFEYREPPVAKIWKRSWKYQYRNDATLPGQERRRRQRYELIRRLRRIGLGPRPIWSPKPPTPRPDLDQLYRRRAS